MQKLRWIERGRGSMEFSVREAGVEAGIAARGELGRYRGSRDGDVETQVIGLSSRG